jgi:uncharacterized protein (TIGR00159 family)
MGFIGFSLIDVVDILTVAFFLYQIYKLIKGTAAMNIFIAVILVYAGYRLVKELKMELTSMILGKFMEVGVIALIILFQQEIRRFLLHIGTRYLTGPRNSFVGRFFKTEHRMANVSLQNIVDACRSMAEKKTGALIVVGRSSSLQIYAETGDVINADVSTRLLENIFFKNSPLHDGAVLVVNNRIHAARCILPSSENFNIPAHFGMRHRAAVGVTEATDAVAIVVSEETGRISYVEDGRIESSVSPERLAALLENKPDKPDNNGNKSND